jgi:hypothetical protein
VQVVRVAVAVRVGVLVPFGVFVPTRVLVGVAASIAVLAIVAAPVPTAASARTGRGDNASARSSTARVRAVAPVMWSLLTMIRCPDAKGQNGCG